MNAKRPEAQVAGMVNHAQGAHFETRLLASFTMARMKGLANIRKNNEPMKPIRQLSDGKFVAVYTQKSNIDFCGELAGGRMAAFEAKFTTTDRITQDRVTADQTVTMNTHEEFGAECWVLCGFLRGGVYKVPWRAWREMKERFGRKYVTEDDLRPWICPVKSNGLPEIIPERGGDMERPDRKDTLAIADKMAQLVRLVAFANGLTKFRTFSLSYNGARWFELSVFDQESGRKTYIVGMDTPITTDNLNQAVEKMLEVVASVGGR